jgi:hypothetical protein
LPNKSGLGKYKRFLKAKTSLEKSTAKAQVEKKLQAIRDKKTKASQLENDADALLNSIRNEMGIQANMTDEAGAA